MIMIHTQLHVYPYQYEHQNLCFLEIFYAMYLFILFVQYVCVCVISMNEKKWRRFGKSRERNKIITTINFALKLYNRCVECWH